MGGLNLIGDSDPIRRLIGLQSVRSRVQHAFRIYNFAHGLLRAMDGFLDSALLHLFRRQTRQPGSAHGIRLKGAEAANRVQPWKYDGRGPRSDVFVAIEGTLRYG